MVVLSLSTPPLQPPAIHTPSSGLDQFSRPFGAGLALSSRDPRMDSFCLLALFHVFASQFLLPPPPCSNPELFEGWANCLDNSYVICQPIFSATCELFSGA